jgi:hypothetical protein
MWGTADELLSLVRGMRRSLTDDEQHKIAAAIVEHL